MTVTMDRRQVAVPVVRPIAIAVDVLPGMNAGASTHAVPSPIEGSGTAWVLLGSWALSPARPTPIHPRRERRGLSALLVMEFDQVFRLEVESARFAAPCLFVQQ